MMLDHNGENVDLYTPRKCNVNRRLITSTDHGAVQLHFCGVDENGCIDHSQIEVVSISGASRRSAITTPLIFERANISTEYTDH